MKRFIKIAVSVATLFGIMTSCQREDFILPDINDVPEGYRTIEFMAEVPQMNEVHTKAGDPDGGGVQNMTSFCFDVNGLFITTVTAEITSRTDELNGKFKANIPDHTTVMHFIGNQNLTYFEEDSYRGRSEVDIMHDLEASAGRMIYWAKETVEDINSRNSESDPVRLIRNQALFTLEVASGVDFTPTGWIVVNTNAFGTVAPYCAEHGFETPHYLDRPFVTMPENTAKLGDFLDVRNNPREYVFETENTADSPIDFIVKGYTSSDNEEKYYRISIIDGAGEYIPVYRNHHYKVIIEGEPVYGQSTFEDALKAPATNNIFVSVSDDIRELTDGVNTLSVDQTYVVIPEENIPSQGEYYYLTYSFSSSSSNPPTPEVSWLAGNNVALQNFSHDGAGTIGINLNQLGDLQKREGTLLIKYGRLTRKIKVITIKKQSFVPAWITTNIHGVETGEKVTMMFTIPETCPKELFPMDVLVTVNDLDIRNASGMKLPVITQTENPDRYGADNGIGYKYVLTAEGPGTQRLYLKTILCHEPTVDENGNTVEPTVNVTIEAEHFTTLTKTATLHDDDVDARILLHDFGSYVAALPADEVIYYYLVPQKVNAPVEIGAHLGVVYDEESEAIAEGGYHEEFTNALGTYYVRFVEHDPADEFLFYSRNLDHNVDVDFIFHPILENEWSTGGRVHGFTRNSSGPTVGNAVFHMVTNTPKSAEVVRIASNPKGSDSVTGSGLCNGNQYRSVVFELANYHPFHFDATINTEGTIVDGENEEVTDDVLITYEPDQTVVLDFAVTSFLSQHRDYSGNVLPDNEQIYVDPFGTEFDIYIDAPMFDLDPNQDLVELGKLEEDRDVEGRYIYHVDADRSVEDTYAKTILFRPKNIVSNGEVKISADDSVVIFYDKTFRVSNSSITGTIRYQDGNTLKPVPENSFVSFEMLPTYNRIGTVAVNDGGQFEIRLRSEYRYDWKIDDVKLQFTDENETIYEARFGSLDELYNSVENGTDIVLKVPPTE